MQELERIPFEFEGKEYEIRVVFHHDAFHISTFLKNKPANGYTYSVRQITAFDLKKAMGLDAIKELVKTAKNDVINKNWERYLDAVSKIKK